MRLQQIALLLGLLLITSPALAVRRADRRGEQSLRWAERQLEQELHPADGSHTGWLYGVSEARDSFEEILTQYGGSARAYVGLGKCQQRLGDYGAALRSFEKAQTLTPASRAAREGAVEVRRSLQVARAVAPQLTPRERVLQVGRVADRPDGALWAVLSAEPTGDSGMWGQEYRAPRVALFQQRSRGYRRLWRSEELRDSRFKDDEWDRVMLDVFNYTGNRVPEAAIWKQCIGADWDPCHLEIFKLRASRLSQILSVTSDEEFWVKDPKHDERYEVQNEHSLGPNPPRMEQHRRREVYAYDPVKGRYILRIAREVQGRVTRRQSTGADQGTTGEVRSGGSAD